jgi:hypothetical protein
MANEQLQIVRGDDWKIDIAISDPEGAGVDFSGATLTLSLSRRNDLASRATPLIALASPARLTITQLSDKTTIVGELTAAETTALPTGFVYLWLLSVSASDTITWIREAVQVV